LQKADLETLLVDFLVVFCWYSKAQNQLSERKHDNAQEVNLCGLDFM